MIAVREWQETMATGDKAAGDRAIGDLASDDKTEADQKIGSDGPWNSDGRKDRSDATTTISPPLTERLSTPDVARYRRFVAHLQCSEAEKDELIRIVWRIMASFVDRAWGDDPAQQYTQKLIGGTSKISDDHAKLPLASDTIIDLVPLDVFAGDERTP